MLDERMMRVLNHVRKVSDEGGLFRWQRGESIFRTNIPGAQIEVGKGSMAHGHPFVWLSLYEADGVIPLGCLSDNPNEETVPSIEVLGMLHEVHRNALHFVASRRDQSIDDIVRSLD